MYGKLTGVIMMFLGGASSACVEGGSDGPPGGVAGERNAPDEAASGGADSSGALSEEVRAACLGMCELDAVLSAVTTCVPGRDVVQNGKLVGGEGGAGFEPEPTEPSEECLQGCHDGWMNTPAECHPGYLRALACVYDSVWTCTEVPPGSGQTGWSGGEPYPDCAQVMSDLAECAEE